MTWKPEAWATNIAVPGLENRHALAEPRGFAAVFSVRKAHNAIMTERQIVIDKQDMTPVHNPCLLFVRFLSSQRMRNVLWPFFHFHMNIPLRERDLDPSGAQFLIDKGV